MIAVVGVRGTSVVRRAPAGDAEEVLRLRQVMIDALPGGDSSTQWHARSLPALRGEAGRRGRGLGRVRRRPSEPAGRGYVFSVATDPDARRRGYARACMDELPAWFRERGAGQVMLTASPEAEQLYASLGFVHKPDPTMILAL